MLPRLTFIRVFPINLLMGYLLAAYLLVGTALLVVSQFSFADEVYIRDTLYVPLRGGESTKHRIIHRGAGVVLIGLLLGFLLGRRIYHKRYNGSWL